MRKHVSQPDQALTNWVGTQFKQSKDGILLPVKKAHNTRAMIRRLRIQRTLSWCLVCMMGLSYIAQKFIW
jgi:hypothetical protein